MQIPIELPEDIFERMSKQAIYEGLTQIDWCRTTIIKRIREHMEDDPLPEDIERGKQFEKQKMERFLNAKNREEQMHEATLEFMKSTTTWMQVNSDFMKEIVGSFGLINAEKLQKNDTIYQDKSTEN